MTIAVDGSSGHRQEGKVLWIFMMRDPASPIELRELRRLGIENYARVSQHQFSAPNSSTEWLDECERLRRQNGADTVRVIMEMPRQLEAQAVRQGIRHFAFDSRGNLQVMEQPVVFRLVQTDDI
jgi:hypothetical protein